MRDYRSRRCFARSSYLLTPAEHEAICRALIDQGKLIEAEFMALRFCAMDADALEVEVREARQIFFLGAQYVFSRIRLMLEPGAEVTENDRTRITLFQTELETFVEQLLKSAG